MGHPSAISQLRQTVGHLTLAYFRNDTLTSSFSPSTSTTLQKVRWFPRLNGF
jgi:hypothetical protein